MKSPTKSVRETAKYAAGLTKIWDEDTPSQLIFFVTNKCNGHCRHCFYWNEINGKKSDELSLSEIEKISELMGRLLWLFISGGEPFLRKDLAEICAIFYQNNHPNSIVIPTNGLLVKETVQTTKIICQKCPEAKIIIQLSIDDIGKKHDKIRGVEGNYAKIKKLATDLNRLKNDYPNLAIQGNIVFNADNQDQIKKIYDTLYKNFKLDNICVSLVRGNPREVGLKNVNLKKYQEIHQYIQRTKRFTQYSSILSNLITKKEDMQTDLFLNSFKENKMVIPCLAGRQTVVLAPNGDLLTCELRSEKYGNLREVNYDFKKLWHSPVADLIRKKVVGCWCTQECVYTVNVFLNPQAWPRFLKYLLLGKI